MAAVVKRKNSDGNSDIIRRTKARLPGIPWLEKEFHIARKAFLESTAESVNEKYQFVLNILNKNGFNRTVAAVRVWKCFHYLLI